MLVLSRKTSEDLVFPSLGVTIRVLKTDAHCVKLGVIAPQQSRVVGGELLGISELIQSLCDMKDRILSHDLKNRVNALVLKMKLLDRLQLPRQTSEHAEVMDSVAQGLQDLEHDFTRLAHGSPGGARPPEKLRLLLVDDDANERELLSAVLSLHGFDVSAAEDGVEALDRLNQSSRLPHAVLLDLQMPRLSGESTLRCIRADHRFRQLRVIGVSGNDPQLHSLPDEFKGFDAWFSKPLQLEQLVSLIQEPRFVMN